MPDSGVKANAKNSINPITATYSRSENFQASQLALAHLRCPSHLGNSPLSFPPWEISLIGVRSICNRQSSSARISNSGTRLAASPLNRALTTGYHRLRSRRHLFIMFISIRSYNFHLRRLPCLMLESGLFQILRDGILPSRYTPST